jgi:2-dehydro-3-deoxygalactonokinase
MGGETAKLLSRDSLISRLIPQDASFSEAGYQRGLDAAWDNTLPGGTLRRLFSARSLVLFERMPAEEIGGYIAGLLAGAEIAEAETEWALRDAPILVLGQSPEAGRYLHALRQRGIPAAAKRAAAATSFATLHRALSRPAQFA